jgi:hypothetical protein
MLCIETNYSTFTFEIINPGLWQEAYSEEAILKRFEFWLAFWHMISMKMVNTTNVSTEAAALVVSPRLKIK